MTPAGALSCADVPAPLREMLVSDGDDFGDAFNDRSSAAASSLESRSDWLPTVCQSIVVAMTPMMNGNRIGTRRRRRSRRATAGRSIACAVLGADIDASRREES